MNPEAELSQLIWIYIIRGYSRTGVRLQYIAGSSCIGALARAWDEISVHANTTAKSLKTSRPATLVFSVRTLFPTS